METQYVSFKGKRKATAQTVALIMAVVGQGQAMAQMLYGGGATLPAEGYVDPAPDQVSRQSINGPDGALFKEVLDAHGFSVSYCQTGSTTGKRMLIGTTGYSAGATCPAFSVTPTGFGALPTSQAAPHFSASDAPLTDGENNTFVTGPHYSTHSATVQIPVVAGAIAIVFNNPDIAATARPSLTTAQVCQIFSGQITNWTQLTGTGFTFSSRPIKVAYRSDGSGTTFSFANFLTGAGAGNTACVGYVSGGVTRTFITDQSFSLAVSQFLDVASFAGTFLPGSGNPGVVDAVGANPGAIGYAELANAKQENPALAWFKVNGKDPNTADFPNVFAVGTYTTGVAIASVNTVTGRPVLGAVTSHNQPQCLLMVPPDNYANPTTYPIVAISNLLGYYTGNGTNVTRIEQLLRAPHTGTIRATTTTIGGSGDGLAWLSGTVPGGDSMTTRINSCIN